ncbi:hypothetical protein HF086_002246 [Spodoptera exigua]|uniref:PPIase cyclophilin-type domain-containing protein n=1 Tax=Spodoptera exigua TaxID=7107 RepID=A0A922MS12_SPOEX|nr:hypothetical protein HF086_002246 [Spodoptera exigua]
MHPLRERKCDELLEHPLLRTPPPEPEKPRIPRLQMSKAKVDDSPPELFPELYLKPRRLDFYARQLEHTMNVNKELLKKINLIQRTGGFVDCWRPEPSNKYNKLLCKQRQRDLNKIQLANYYFYSRLLVARSEQLLTKELDKALPFILFKTGKLDRDIKDPAFDKPLNVIRPKVSMEIWVRGGSKIGKVLIELFSDIVPQTCQFFLNLVKGDSSGHSYTGTRFFRFVPDYLSVLSMVITPDGEATGQFNIIFKPLPQFDKRHVVFGRIVAGPAPTLERISALGLPLGTTTTDCIIQSCGWYTKYGRYREGSPNTIKFPPRRKLKK